MTAMVQVREDGGSSGKQGVVPGGTHRGEVRCRLPLFHPLQVDLCPVEAFPPPGKIGNV